jgi:hypothetical protein
LKPKVDFKLNVTKLRGTHFWGEVLGAEDEGRYLAVPSGSYVEIFHMEFYFLVYPRGGH